MDTSLSILPRRLSLMTFFLLTFALSWGMWIPAVLAAKGWLSFPIPDTLAQLLGAWMPSLVAIVLTAVMDGRTGLRILLGRLLVWRVGVQWYLFALLWPAILSLAVTGISMLLGSPAPDFANPPVMTVYPVPPEALSAGFLPLLPMVFVIQFFGSSMGEELGWRGFALPRFQSRWNALLAGGVIGLIWGIWHFPRVWVPGEPFDVTGFGWLIIGLVLYGVLYAWMFNNTRGSLLLALLLHTTQAVTNLFLAEVSNPLIENGLMIVVVGLVVWGYGAVRLGRQPISAA